MLALVAIAEGDRTLPKNESELIDDLRRAVGELAYLAKKMAREGVEALSPANLADRERFQKEAFEIRKRLGTVTSTAGNTYDNISEKDLVVMILGRENILLRREKATWGCSCHSCRPKE